MKYAQFIAVLGVFFLLVWLRGQMGGDEAQPVIVGNSQSTATSSPTDNSAGTSPTPNPTSQSMMGNSNMGSHTGQYKDGTYTGSLEDAYYGNYQVAAVISGGKITDVQFLQYPNDNRTSISINSQASVFLKEEALQAQSANVDIVSGASQSSMAFQRSLQTALNQAH